MRDSRRRTAGVLTLGLRPGEVFGLVRTDVDFDRRTLRVGHAVQRVDGAPIFKEPKPVKSRRTLPPFSVAALRTHQDRQAFERAAASDRWQDSYLVFAAA